MTEREPAVHVLVNNAGAAWGAPLEEYPESAWDKVLSTNVKGPFLLTQALLGALRAGAQPDDPARVINIGSIEGFAVPLWNNYAYPASKAAVHQMTRHLAADLAPDITVNAIAPGLFPSKMTAFAFQPGAEEEIVKHIPMHRAGPPVRHGRRRDVPRQHGRVLRDRRRAAGRRRPHPARLTGSVNPRRLPAGDRRRPSPTLAPTPRRGLLSAAA